MPYKLPDEASDNPWRYKEHEWDEIIQEEMVNTALQWEPVESKIYGRCGKWVQFWTTNWVGHIESDYYYGPMSGDPHEINARFIQRNPPVQQTM